MVNPTDGFLIPGEVAMGNCYKVFLDDKLFAVVKHEAIAELLIAAITRSSVVTKDQFSYQLAFIENIGF